MNDRFYVLWVNEHGVNMWSGPYESFEDTRAIRMRLDPAAKAFVTMIGGSRWP